MRAEFEGGLDESELNGTEVRDESVATFIEPPPKKYHHQNNLGTISRRRPTVENAYF